MHGKKILHYLASPNYSLKYVQHKRKKRNKSYNLIKVKKKIIYNKK